MGTAQMPLLAALTAAGEQGGRELTATVLRKDLGQTAVEGQTRFGRPAWACPSFRGSGVHFERPILCGKLASEETLPRV